MPADSSVRSLIDRITNALGSDATPERVERIARAVLGSHGASFSPRAAAAPDVSHRGPAPGDTRFLVTAYGADTPGILATLTGELAEAGANILDVSQKVLQSYFTVILLADLPHRTGSLGALRKRLEARAETLGVRVLVQHEELFQAMHRP